ncbi:MAG: hypothetical protein ACRDHY_15520 [Anaerolineales bacterium]
MRDRKPRPGQDRSRIPQDSFLYGKAVPIVLGGLGLITTAMILFALGVLIGWIPFR